MPSSTDNPELGIYQLPPYHLLNPQGRSPVVLVCEHASRHIPLELQRLGLDQAAAEEHIAWDIGALALAEELSRRLDAPLLAAGYSRLLIDLNRPLEAPDSIPPHSEVYPVPGNRELSETVRRYRQDCLFHPFHQRLTQLLDERQAAGVPTRVVGVHSFTPVYHGRPRPLVAGVLSQRRRLRQAHPRRFAPARPGSRRQPALCDRPGGRHYRSGAWRRTRSGSGAAGDPQRWIAHAGCGVRLGRASVSLALMR